MREKGKNAIMNEMIYQAEPKREILIQGEYSGHKFAIVSLGTHPVAYVECKIKDLDGYTDTRLDEVQVHGCFTYFGEALLCELDTTLYLGWGYMHFNDYKGFMPFLNGKKWTTAEIYEEVMSVIDQLSKIEKKKKNS